MKPDVDKAIDRVLAGLRETELPEGLEQRVLVAVRERSATDVRPGVAPWLAWAVAAVVVAAVAWPVVSHLRRKADVDVAARPSPVLEVPGGAQRPQQMEAHAGPEKIVTAATKPMPAGSRSIEVATDASTRRVRMSESDLRALEEMRAPSKPAPPEPLTAQERTLLHIAVQGTEEQLAALNPVVREARYQEAKAAVMEFFEPPKPKADEQE